MLVCCFVVLILPRLRRLARFRERQRDRDRDSDRERETERVGGWVNVCAYVRGHRRIYKTYYTFTYPSAYSSYIIVIPLLKFYSANIKLSLASQMSNPVMPKLIIN